MTCVNVFLKDELLEETNHEADVEETNRSALISEPPARLDLRGITPCVNHKIEGAL